LRVEGLPVGGTSALTFDVKDGQCAGLLGRDLAALRDVTDAIGGLRVPGAGRILIDDRDILADRDRTLRETAVAIARAAHPSTTLGEHAGTIASARKTRMTAADGIARLGLLPRMRLNTPAARAAASLIGALIADARVIVLHDPFRDLASDTREKAIAWIRSLAGSDVAVVITGSEERDVRAVSHLVIDVGAGR